MEVISPSSRGKERYIVLKKINSKGIDDFIRDLPAIDFSEVQHLFQVPAGEVLHVLLPFSIQGEEVKEGFIHSDALRIIPAMSAFSGTSGTIEAVIDARGLNPGDSFTGHLHLTGDVQPGELELKVQVIEQKDRILPPKGVRDLKSYTLFYKQNPREAFRFFARGEFERILDKEAASIRLLYRGLSQNPVTYQHLEEFLTATGQKERLSFSMDRSGEEYYSLRASRKSSLYIYRNTFGYAHLNVKVHGDFIRVTKKVITTEDFIGKVYGLEFVIDASRLSDGISRGTIRISDVHQSLIFQIAASGKPEKHYKRELQKRQERAELSRILLDLQLHHLDYPAWQEKSLHIVNKQIKGNPADTAAHLYRAFLAWSREETEAALEDLIRLRDEKGYMESPEAEAVYLVLSKRTGLLPEERRNILPILRRLYAGRPDSWLILYLLQEELKDNLRPADRLRQMEACYEAGNNSPFLFLEAWRILEKDEALLRSISPFMIRILAFGIRRGEIRSGLIERAAYLSKVNLKKFSPSLFRILVKGYEKYESDPVLEAILKMILLDNPLKPSYFRFYQSAVKRDLRIVRLYEYYMETCPFSAEEELPALVRMYFAYNDTLGDRAKALLYAGIILHKKIHPQDWSNYKDRIRTFAANSLAAGKINANYLLLYKEFYEQPENRRKAAELSAMIGACKFYCPDPGMRSVLVRHADFQREERYDLQDQVAWPRIWSKDALLLLEDEKKRRFPVGEDCILEPLSSLQAAALPILQTGLDSSRAEWLVCSGTSHTPEPAKESIGFYILAAGNNDFTEDYRTKIRKKILAYYQKDPEAPGLEAFRRSMDPEVYGRSVKKEACRLLITHGSYEKAFQILLAFGVEGIEMELLVRLTSRMILQVDMEFKEELLALAEHVYAAGKYDDLILVYLRDYSQGSAKKLAELWEKVGSFGLERSNLEELILRRAMVEHSLPIGLGKIYSDYIRHSGKQELIRAFTVYLSACFFLKGSAVPEEVFYWIQKMLHSGWEIDKVCRMALLLHYTELDTLTEEQLHMAEKLLLELNEEGYRFRFWQELPTKLAQEFAVDDKIFVETIVQDAASVTLHYQIQGRGKEEASWISEPMREKYHGIYSREFLMFYGEKLVYFLTVEKHGTIERTPVGRGEPPETGSGGRTRYALINRMLQARDEQDAHHLEKALKTYLWQEAYVDRYFKLQ